jgi:hypothetical protein
LNEQVDVALLFNIWPMSGKYPVRMLVGLPVILVQVLGGFPQDFQANAGVFP